MCITVRRTAHLVCTYIAVFMMYELYVTTQSLSGFCRRLLPFTDRDYYAFHENRTNFLPRLDVEDDRFYLKNLSRLLTHQNIACLLLSLLACMYVCMYSVYLSLHLYFCSHVTVLFLLKPRPNYTIMHSPPFHISMQMVRQMCLMCVGIYVLNADRST